MSAFHPYIRQKPLINFEENLRSMFPDLDTTLAAMIPDTSSATTAATAQHPERSRRKRTTFSPDQAARLEQEYLNDCYMAREKRQILASTLNLSENQVKTWFQNRRAKDKRDRKSHHTNSPPSSSPPPTPPNIINNNNTTSDNTANNEIGKMIVTTTTPPIQQSPCITLNLLSDYANYLQSLGAFPVFPTLPISSTSSSSSSTTTTTPTVPISTVPPSFFTI